MNKKRLLVLLPLFALASCGGYSIQYLVEGDTYDSPIFQKNYYRHWDDDLKNAKKVVDHELITENDRILNIKDLGKIDRNFVTHNPYEHDVNVSDYGENFCLSSYDESFNYGVQSRLFDGLTICGGLTTKRRIQVDKNGFSIRFTKESNNQNPLSYFAVQFKGACDFTNPDLKAYFGGSPNIEHQSTLTSLTVSIYVKNDEEQIERHNFTTNDLVIKKTNAYLESEHPYLFYAFDLSEANLTRMIGFSMEYEFSDEAINAIHESKPEVNIDYSLFLYEVFLPYTTWH